MNDFTGGFKKGTIAVIAANQGVGKSKMTKRNYTNTCPNCGEPFFCTDKRDFDCPYCKIEMLKKECVWQKESYEEMYRSKKAIIRQRQNWYNKYENLLTKLENYVNAYKGMLPVIERLVEEENENMHKEFRK